ncbi:hypothetical protein PHMEG_0005846 [Phytophthora megakarya]|uniref:CCHC-type domain-containing protein n=1 Tax=Phytophthora megakarya TaxID=4795 RepID=A0A225WQH9_9STRA|nr:hypothetical protein PHMEG_0005846 [Phytophthora megakarya]
MSSNTPTAFTTKLRKFDGSGYRVWARRLELYLEVKQRERSLHQLKLQHKLAMTIILAALTDDQAALVADFTHPQDMLQALQKTYFTHPAGYAANATEDMCGTTVGAVKRQYMSLYIDAGGGMLEHIRLPHLMLVELECYKVSLSDAEKKSNFLQSLGPDWNGYIGALEACGSMEELLIKAAAEARRRPTQAQRSKHGSSKAVNSSNVFTASSPGKQGAKKGKCYNCGKRGHFKNECKSKKQFGDAFGNATSSADSSDKAETGFVFQVSTQAAGADWVIDSGASNHMTGTSGLLSNLHELTSSVVVTSGSGTALTATHSGKPPLPLITGGSCTLDNVLYVPGLQRNLVSLTKVGATGLTASCNTLQQWAIVLAGKTSMEVLTGHTPVLNKLRVVGSDAEVLLAKSQRQKLDAKTAKGVFIGVPKRMIMTLDGDLPASPQEEVASDQVPTGLDAIPEDIDMESGGSSVSEQSRQALVDPRGEKQVVRRSTRIKKKSARRLDFEESHNTQKVALVSELQDPLTLQEALARPDAEQWRQVIHE